MKRFFKILLYILAALLLIVAGFAIYISVIFNKLEFDDQFAVKEDYAAYFVNDYTEARSTFRQKTTELAGRFAGVQQFGIPVPSEIDADLTVDIAYIPALGDSSKLLIISSGVHGVEGYVGHAVQLMFMQELLDSSLLSNTGVLFLHTINPYGFKYSRRVSENNVDLNRNSYLGDELYSTVNSGYPEVYALVNPQKEADVSSLENRFFFIKAVKAIAEATMPVLRQALLQGQYSYPEGLYYGGNANEPQIKSLVPVIDSLCAPYEQILAIDLHTGYGVRGNMHLFPNPVEPPKKQQLEDLFSGYTIDWGDSDDFYTVTGDFVNFLGQINSEKTFYPMTLEYGTLNSQTTLGSLKSIHIMILENQGIHHGYASETDSLKIKNDLLEMYNPGSANWRNHIMQQSKELFTSLLPRFQEL